MSSKCYVETLQPQDKKSGGGGSERKVLTLFRKVLNFMWVKEKQSSTFVKKKKSFEKKENMTLIENQNQNIRIRSKQDLKMKK